MNEDKVIDKLFKYITSKSRFKYKIFRNVYGISIEKYIQSNLRNGEYWTDFENENYEIILNQEHKAFKFFDGKIINSYDMWIDGVGKLKKKLFDYDEKLELFKKYRNFAGFIFENKVIDKKFIEFHQNSVLADIIFNRCNFQKLIIKNYNNFTKCSYNQCDFYEVKFIEDIIYQSIFKDCEFKDCKFEGRTDYSLRDEYLKRVGYYKLEGINIYSNFNSVTFNNCEFNLLMITNYYEFEKCYYNDCKFLEVQFSGKLLNENYFTRCIFSKCKDFHSEMEHLGYYESIELEFNKICTYLNENIFKKCSFSFNFNSSLLYRNTFVSTIFETCKSIDSGLYYNKFNKCTFDCVTFKNHGKKIDKWGEYEILLSNKFKKCRFNNADFSEAILIRCLFDSNKYDDRTEFSIKYYEDVTNINIILTQDELKYMDESEKGIEFIKGYMSLYHNLFTEYKDTVMQKKAYEYYYIYKCLELKLNYKSLFYKPSTKTVKEYFFSLFLYKTCGFGERPIKALTTCFCVIILCSFLYLFLGIDGKEPILYLGVYHDLNSIFPQGYIIKDAKPSDFINDFFTSVYFSIISFATIGYGDLTPLTIGSRILVCVQSIISILLVALFTGTFIRKSFRD